MAKLSKMEKEALLAVSRRAPQADSALPKLTPQQYLDFAKQMSQLVKPRTEVGFVGDKWRL